MRKKGRFMICIAVLAISLIGCSADHTVKQATVSDDTVSTEETNQKDQTIVGTEETSREDQTIADTEKTSDPIIDDTEETKDQIIIDFDAKNYVEILCNGDVSSLETDYNYSEQVSAALKMQGGLESLQKTLQEFGKLKELGNSIVTQVENYTSYSVPCIFENNQINLVITLNQERAIAGLVVSAYQNEDAALENKEALPDNIREIEYHLPVKGHEDWSLPGILTVPQGEGPFPCVVLVHGSGPNDKDETIYQNKPFRDIAWFLAEKGIAVYRYDKRSYVYGSEFVKDPSLTLNEETVIDAVTAVELLKEQEMIDSSCIYVLGHSLGGQALPRINEMLLWQDSSVAGFIFLAAPARNFAELMREQYDFLYSLTPILTEEAKEQKSQIYKQLDQLTDFSSLKEEEMILNAYGTYWKDLLSYDQVQSAKEITVPCLVLQGEEDYQVTMEDFNIWKETFSEEENWTFHSYAGLTHLFMSGKRENASNDYVKKQTVNTQVLSDIVEFIKVK